MGLTKRINISIANHNELAGRGASDAHPQSAVTGLETKLGSHDTAISNITGRLDTTEPTIANHESRLDTVEPTIANHESRLDTVEPTIADHESRLDTAEPTIADNKSRLDMLELHPGTASVHVVKDGTLQTGLNVEMVGGFKLWVGTQTEYDAIGVKDANTLYFIK
jgi:chromosome segregation ATPase